MKDDGNFKFPISNFQERCKNLKWFLERIPTKNGIYCESCLKWIPWSSDALCLGAIVDRKPSENIMDHCPGRVLPCCISCGLKHNIIKQKDIDSITEEFLAGSEKAWKNELHEIDQFCDFAFMIAIRKNIKSGGSHNAT